MCGTQKAGGPWGQEGTSQDSWPLMCSLEREARTLRWASSVDLPSVGTGPELSGGACSGWKGKCPLWSQQT